MNEFIGKDISVTSSTTQLLVSRNTAMIIGRLLQLPSSKNISLREISFAKSDAFYNMKLKFGNVSLFFKNITDLTYPHVNDLLDKPSRNSFSCILKDWQYAAKALVNFDDTDLVSVSLNPVRGYLEVEAIGKYKAQRIIYLTFDQPADQIAHRNPILLFRCNVVSIRELANYATPSESILIQLNNNAADKGYAVLIATYPLCKRKEFSEQTKLLFVVEMEDLKPKQL